MHFGLDIVPFGPYADPRNVVEIAQAAEAAGWEGLFVWDHLAFTWGIPSGDTWVILSAVAQATERLVLGPLISPLPRYRPQMLANAIATLDLLSAGRLVLGAGLGALPDEFTAFGEPGEARIRAVMADESLAILDGLLRGETVHFSGQHYIVRDIQLAPLPLQQPRPPFWIGGDSPPALRRASRWEGWAVGSMDQDSNLILPPEQFAAKLDYIQQQRTSGAPFAAVITGSTPAGETALVREFAAAGATWWLETIAPILGSQADMLGRVRFGPPRW